MSTTPRLPRRPTRFAPPALLRNAKQAGLTGSLRMSPRRGGTRVPVAVPVGLRLPIAYIIEPHQVGR
jgi:hypothetical protein